MGENGGVWITKILRIGIIGVLLVPVVAADDFTEDFESFETTGLLAVENPDQAWYNYAESNDYGLINTVGAIAGSQDMLFTGETTTSPSSNRATFSLEIPTQLSSTEFTIRGRTVNETGGPTQQFVALESFQPQRTLVEFYLFCLEGDACELRVKFDHTDSTGQVLINHTTGLKVFNIELFFDWVNSEFCLFVNSVDDGCFSFLELPGNFSRLRFQQFRGDVRSEWQFDDWTVRDAVAGNATSVVGDITIGMKNFATDINITSAGSLFLFGLILLLTITMALFLPMSAVNRSKAIAPVITFVIVLTIFWLIDGEFWPDWPGITMIIVTGAMVGTLIRRQALGMRDATTGPALVAGSLGYFIITTTLLGFSGYATDTIQLPDQSPTQVNETGEPEPVQGYIVAGVECAVTGFGLFSFSDCSRFTETEEFSIITDIFGWIRAAFNFLFQLLSFQLPIPVVFSMMIVLPPASALATYAFSVIRGAGS